MADFQLDTVTQPRFQVPSPLLSSSNHVTWQTLTPLNPGINSSVDDKEWASHSKMYQVDTNTKE